MLADFTLKKNCIRASIFARVLLARLSGYFSPTGH
jgi:hypothetical protein